MLVTTSGQVPIWRPSDAQVQAAQMTAFINRVAGHPSGGAVKDYEPLYSWSIERPEHFWPAVADSAASCRTNCTMGWTSAR